MTIVDRVLTFVSDALMNFGVVIAILMAVHVVADVLSKFLFNFPLAGTLEIVAHYYMVGLIFLPLAYVQRRDGHIAAELLTRYMSPRAQNIVAVLTYLLMAGFAALLAWRSSIDALRSLEVAEAVQTSGYFVYIFPARWFVPLGVGLMGIFALVQAGRTARSLADRR
jgi:TRAP-type C4-dicarboxylate transport system permease small subunit